MRQLRFWTPPEAGSDTLRLLRARLKGFERSRKTTVEVRVLPLSALWARFVDGLKGGPLPDAAAIPGHWTASLDRLGLLRGLSSAAPAFDLSTAYAPLRPHALSPLSGELVSVPWWMEVGVLQARSDLLEECGVDPGSLGDWEGLSAACKRLSRLRRRGIAPLTGADPMRPGTLEDLAPRIWSRGGEFLSPDGSRALFAREEAGRAFLDFFSLVEEGSVPISGPAGLPPGDISSGSCALQLSGRVSGSSKDGGAGAAALAPPSSEREAPLLSARHLAVFDGELFPESCALIHFLAGSARLFARDIGALPAREDALAEALEGMPEAAGTLRSCLSRARTLPDHPLFPPLGRILERASRRVVESIWRRTFTRELLREETVHAAAEADHLLSLYA
ncbi:MAG: hypothetical protein AAB412_06400 [Elusimicrobiota bacterium]